MRERASTQGDLARDSDRRAIKGRHSGGARVMQDAARYRGAGDRFSHQARLLHSARRLERDEQLRGARGAPPSVALLCFLHDRAHDLRALGLILTHGAGILDRFGGSDLFSSLQARSAGAIRSTLGSRRAAVRSSCRRCFAGRLIVARLCECRFDERFSWRGALDRRRGDGRCVSDRRGIPAR